MTDIFENGTRLPIIEDFYTVQGEGFQTGKAAYFVRLGGCDIGCRWCDTKFSWNANLHQLQQVDDYVKKAASFPAKAVVVTGGEPLNYDLNYFCNQLKLNNVQTFIETSGAYPVSGNWDWICLSPKRNSKPVNEIYTLAHELKVIIYEQADFDWAEENAAKVNSNCHLFLQPEWSRHKELTPVIIDYVKNNPKWQISLQSHKFMKIP